jgi:hypothetical protein
VLVRDGGVVRMKLGIRGSVFKSQERPVPEKNSG